MVRSVKNRRNRSKGIRQRRPITGAGVIVDEDDGSAGPAGNMVSVKGCKRIGGPRTFDDSGRPDPEKIT